MATSDAPQRCMVCSAPLESPIGCIECHSVFPTRSELNHFDRLGLPAAYRLEPKELERRFLAWSRELHPDFFQGRAPSEQHLSLSLSAALNDAYATLKDPVRRAEYLLGLWGGPSPSQQRTMPPAFLERVLDLRMAIAEAKEAGGAELASLEKRLRAEREETMQRVATLFDQAAARPASPQRPAWLLDIRGQLNTVKYLDGLLRDLAEG